MAARLRGDSSHPPGKERLGIKTEHVALLREKLVDSPIDVGPNTSALGDSSCREIHSAGLQVWDLRERKKVEALFAELKNQIGLRRLRRRLKFVREQFFLAAAAQNIKRLVRFLSQPTTPILPAAA